MQPLRGDRRQAADGGAQVDIDLSTHAVRIESDKPKERFGEAISEAGYAGELQAA